MSEQVALDYLRKQVEAEMIGDHHGLNRLPYILFPRVAKLMVDFAQESLAESKARGEILDDVQAKAGATWHPVQPEPEKTA